MSDDIVIEALRRYGRNVTREDFDNLGPEGREFLALVIPILCTSGGVHRLNPDFFERLAHQALADALNAVRRKRLEARALEAALDEIVLASLDAAVSQADGHA